MRSSGEAALDAQGHRVLVVLAHEQDRQLPDGRHVERLVEDALLDGPVPEEAHGHPLFLALLEGPGRPAGYAHAAAHDAVGAEHPGSDVGDVHAAALAVAVSGRLAEQLGRHPVEVKSEGDGVAVAAVGAGYHVALPEG